MDRVYSRSTFIATPNVSATEHAHDPDYLYSIRIKSDNLHYLYLILYLFVIQ